MWDRIGPPALRWRSVPDAHGRLRPGTIGVLADGGRDVGCAWLEASGKRGSRITWYWSLTWWPPERPRPRMTLGFGSHRAAAKESCERAYLTAIGVCVEAWDWPPGWRRRGEA